MAEIYTDNLRLPKPGASQGTKTPDYNEALSYLDSTVAGKLTRSVAGSSNVTLTSDEARNHVMEFTGALTGNIIVYLPSGAANGRARVIIVQNSTTGAFTLTFAYQGGTGLTIAQGKARIVFHNGTNVYGGAEFTPSTGAASSGVTLCHVTHNVAQSIATGTTWVALAMNTEDSDPLGMHDTSTNNSRITFSEAMRVRAHGLVVYASNATGFRGASIRKNGTNFRGVAVLNAVNGTDSYVQTIAEFSVVAGDYLELCTLQTSGAPLNATSNADYSPRFWVERVG